MSKTSAKVISSITAYHVVGFVNVPFESVSVVGNWQAARTFLLIVRKWKLATLIKFPLSLLLECGLITPTTFLNWLITLSIGKARSESLEMTTASSKSLSKQSTSRYVAKFTSVPFSSVLSTCTTSGGLVGLRYAKGNCGNTLGRGLKWPLWIVRFGIVLSARR